MGSSENEWTTGVYIPVLGEIRMDWSRAKTILIITFLILDIFLAAQINHTFEEKSLFVKTGNVSDQQVQKFLKDNHVSMMVKPHKIKEVSPYTAEISPLSQGWSQEETGAYTKNYAHPPKVTNTHTLNTFLRKEIPYFSSYKKVQEISQKITYIQFAEGFPLFDAKLEVNLTKDHRIQSLQVLHFQTTKIKKINLISFNNALYNLLYSDDLSRFENPSITDIIFGYRARSDPNTTNSYYLMPYWRFVINGKHFVDVNALGGSIEEPDGNNS
jgi:regulatory protein YycI of two-component signal transduction system YycFG